MERRGVPAGQIQRKERRQQFVKAPRGGGQFERGEGAQRIGSQRLPGSFQAGRQKQQSGQVFVQGYSPLKTSPVTSSSTPKSTSASLLR